MSSEDCLLCYESPGGGDRNPIDESASQLLCNFTGQVRGACIVPVYCRVFVGRCSPVQEHGFAWSQDLVPIDERRREASSEVEDVGQPCAPELGADQPRLRPKPRR